MALRRKQCREQSLLSYYFALPSVPMRFAFTLALLALGCDQPASNEGGSSAIDSTATEASPDAGTTNAGTSDSDARATDSVTTDTVDDGAPDAATPNYVDATTPVVEPCRPAPGTTGAPSTVVEVVQLINGLPHPVTISCFLESLERPLRIIAAASFISAQPAFNVDSPRIFILGNGISLSVVPHGDSQNLLEMGELTSNTRSIKAELEFPILEPLSLDAAFEHIRSEIYGGTVCFGCHHDERAVEDYPVAGAFDSVAYRPLPEYEVNFDYVQYQYATCDAELEPERCGFYTALFGHGEVLPDRFPEEMPLFQ